nr:MAG TPA: Pre-mRNA branch site protein p14 mutant, pre-mRNA splicing, adenine [Caudoviricetes sp.]
MTDKELDKLFEKMSKETANKMNGTHPRPTSKKTVRKPKRK